MAGEMLFFSAGAAGIKAAILNGTRLSEANCGSRTYLWWHSNLCGIWRSADITSWKDYSTASNLEINIQKIPTGYGSRESLFGKNNTGMLCQNT